MDAGILTGIGTALAIVGIIIYVYVQSKKHDNKKI